MRLLSSWIASATQPQDQHPSCAVVILKASGGGGALASSLPSTATKHHAVETDESTCVAYQSSFHTVTRFEPQSHNPLACPGERTITTPDPPTIAALKVTVRDQRSHHCPLSSEGW